MAGSLNKVMIIGHLGRDPEVKTFQNGGMLCNLRVACSESWKDRNSGERKERTEWISVVIHAEGLVKVAEQYLSKGSKVYIEGKIETRKWQDRSGEDRYSTEVVLRPFGGTLILLDSRDGGRSQDRGRSNHNDDRQASGGGQPRPGPADDMDDEIPF